MILVYIRLPKRSASPACTHSPAERKPTLVGSLAYLVDVGTDTETVGGQVHRRARFGSRRALSSSSGSAPIVASSNASSMVPTVPCWARQPAARIGSPRTRRWSAEGVSAVAPLEVVTTCSGPRQAARDHHNDQTHCLRTSGADLPDEDAGRIGPVRHGEKWEHGACVGAESLVVAEEETAGQQCLAAVERGVRHSGLPLQALAASHRQVRGAWAIDGERDERCSHRHGEQCDQIPTDRDAPAHTPPGKINNAVASRERCSDQVSADTDAEQPSHESVHR